MKIDISRVGVKKQKQKSQMNRLYYFLPFVIIVISIYLFKEFDEYIRLINDYVSSSENNTSIWISSLASFWGAILGGIVAGITSIVGIILTIRYYRDADSNNRMLENRPFLNIRGVNFFQNNIPYKIRDLCQFGSGEKHIIIEIVLENIGKNFLRTLTYNDATNFGGYEFNYVIKANQVLEQNFQVVILYDSGCEYKIVFTYMDCFMNEYAQEIIFRVNDNFNTLKDKVNIEANFPILIEKTFS